jgi:hypothetical protein
LGWTYAPIVAILAIFLPLYFPTGRLLSPRWRPVVWLGFGFLVFAVAGNALWPGPDVMVLGLGPVRNPVIFLPRAKPLFELFRMAGALYAYNPSRRYVRAVRAYAGLLRANPRAFLGYYHWQVFYGDTLLPEGYPTRPPIPAPG